MRLLLVEDHAILNQQLTSRLKNDGFEVDSCYDGEEALYYIEQNIHDVILLDRMLPHLSGTEVLSTIRAKGMTIPVILITALGTLHKKVEGLVFGAYDYLLEPFEDEEFAARIRCITRRPATLSLTKEIKYPYIPWKETESKLTGNQTSTFLSKKETALFQFLLTNQGHTLERAHIILKVWGIDSDVEEGNLDNYIHFLRRKLTTVGSAIEIKTIRGIGYRLECY